jgi:hypothetical protein
MTMKILPKLSILLALVGVPAIASAHGNDKDKDNGRDGGDRRAEMMKQFDANGDGKLDDGERQAMRAQRLDEMFARLDTNKDGVISKVELGAGMKAMRGGHHGWKHGKRGKDGKDGKSARRGGRGRGRGRTA